MTFAVVVERRVDVRSRDAEVEELHAREIAAVEEDVRGLEIAVNDARGDALRRALRPRAARARRSRRA